ncbi:ATP synthase subunit I [Limnohabitans sp. Rim11]|uniref:ATP synthase subunit I n=1 Tax=Limnohabitans sp. Rim11 TaxID=1100719 RepID=UPI000B0F412D|nr:ATP synthase subunit I [Limnohabitans sp. Rim11]
MARIPTQDFVDEDGDFNGTENIRPLTAEEVQQLRLQQPLLSIWRVVFAQVLVGLAVAALTWLFTGRVSAAWSAAYGALSVVLPAALFARGLTSKTSSINSGAAVFGFLLWEMVKIGLTVAMLFAATRWVKDLSWPAMLVGLVVTMKVYWVVFAWRKVFHPVA